MPINNFLSIHSADAGELIPINPSFVGHAKNELIVNPAEASSSIVAENGEQASIEFLFEGDYQGRPEKLGEQYRGKGIYLLSKLMELRREDECAEIPFWVVIDQQSLTVGHMRRIVNEIYDVLVTRQYNEQDFWSLKL